MKTAKKLMAVLVSLALLLTLTVLYATAAAEEIPITNPDFERVSAAGDSYEGWINALGAGQTASVVHTDADTNSKVVYLTEQGYIRQEISVLSSTTYRVFFDYKSNGVGAYIKLEGHASSNARQVSTEGEWKRQYVQITTGAEDTVLRIYLRYVDGTGTAATEVCYDNISVIKVTDKEFLPNGDFECGIQGWGLEGNYTYAETTDTKSGKKAIALTAESSKNAALNYTQTSLPAREEGETLYYELTCFVKLEIANTEIHIGTENFTESGYGSNWGKYRALPGGKWIKLSKIIPIRSNEIRIIMKLRVIGGGTAIFDNASLHPLENSVIISDADGAYVEKMADTFRVSVQAAAPKSGAVTCVLAVYKRTSDGVVLYDVQLDEKDETALAASGYGTFSFSVSSLPDFAETEYFAKVMLFNGAGSLSPLDNVIGLTK